MPRRSRVIDTDPFVRLMEEALDAYVKDPSYAIQMARQATTIQNKRDVWQLRLELREAEKTATDQCKNAEAFICENASPCGTGDCRFATGDLVFIVTPALPGKTHRPMPSAFEPTYTIEQAVRPLQGYRASSVR